MIVRLNRSATPFDSWEYGTVRLCEIPDSEKNVSISLLTYSPPLSVRNRRILVLCYLSDLRTKSLMALAASDLFLRRYTHAKRDLSSIKVI
jgi:hypothetical protein